jgi:hypothetical protein
LLGFGGILAAHFALIASRETGLQARRGLALIHVLASTSAATFE